MNILQMSVKDIKKSISYQGNPYSVDEGVLVQLKNDQRKAVRDIYHTIEKLRQAVNDENQRLLKLFTIEQTLWNRGLFYIAGVDEVGRGPLAGPVVASCVIFSNFQSIAGLNDSKLVPAARRAELEDIIKSKALAWGIAVVDNQVIDQINIQKASFLAMKKAIACLGVEPEQLLVDGYPIPEVEYAQQGIIKGDQKSASIAAASILAKCARDRIMDDYAVEYPHYGFEKHKGYGTKEHYQAIKKYGITSIHRKSFLKEGEYN